MSRQWADLDCDGRRLNRIIRILETKLKKTEDDDKTIKYANSIAFLTSKKVEIADRVLGVSHLVKKLEKKYEKQHGKSYDPSEKYRQKTLDEET